MRSLRKPLSALLIALSTTGLVWLASQANPLISFEGRTLDWRFLFRGPRGDRPADLVLVLIEEEAKLPYRSPIPRQHLAQVIEHLAQAKLIGLDILLDQPSFDQAADARLCQALSQGKNVIAVSYLKDSREYRPDPYFADELLDYGYSSFATDADVEVVRWGTLSREVEGGLALSLAGCLYAHYLGLDTSQLRAGMENAAFPTGRTAIDFSGPPTAVYRRAGDLPGGFVVCPSHQVAAGVYPPAFFRDKIVLVGTGLFDAPDRFRTPFFAAAYGYEKTLGVEIHAQFLRTLMQKAPLRFPSRSWELALVFGLALVMAWAVMVFPLANSAGILLALLAGWWMAGFVSFEHKGLGLPLVTPSLALLFAGGAATAYQALTEGKEKRQTRMLFEKYLAPGVVQQLLEDPSLWKLGGKTVDITVMFADLEGFTSMSEKLEPEAMVKLINEFLSEMSDIILSQGGTIDKYEGDLIMAFFGAPLPQADHGARACRAALQMQERMAELREQWKSLGLPELRVRIGLHSGPAVVGNMGSKIRSNYTAMGDTVNLASRLEGTNKQFGTYILISATTCEQAGDAEFNYRRLGEVQVKGKSKPTEVYELLAITHNPPQGRAGE